MMTPLTLDDVEHATDDEIIAAYMLDGDTREQAEAMLAIVRGRMPQGTIID